MEPQALRTAGMRITRPRLKILEILENAPDSARHLSAEDVYKVLLEEGTDVGLGTVYRVLTQFEMAGLVHRLSFSQGPAVFELARGSHHDHMVCVKSGKIIEFVDKKIEKLQEEIAKKHGYELVDHSLVLYVRPR